MKTTLVVILSFALFACASKPRIVVRHQAPRSPISTTWAYDEDGNVIISEALAKKLKY
jgi:hypothetical protein